MSDSSEIARFLAQAEEALSAIYDARGTDMRAALEDARYNFERALGIARMRGRGPQVAEIEKRLARIDALFEARFRKKRPTTP